MSSPTTTDPDESRPVVSLQGRVFAIAGGCLAAGVATSLWLLTLGTGVVLALTAALLVFLPILLWLTHRAMEPTRLRIRALVDSAESLSDADFSTTIADNNNDEVGRLVRAYNRMVATLRDERLNLHQRELMLDTVLQASPLALVLINDRGHVIYANSTARALLTPGQRMAGMHLFDDVASGQPESIREALIQGVDAIVSVDGDGESERYHLSCNAFTLNARRHRLFLLKRLTHELNRQEVATWKKVIRLIGHELNNSLAPISSLAHSAQLLGRRGESERVGELLQTIESRSDHLKAFIESYSKFAKLPTPQPEVIEWDAFFARLKGLQPFEYEPAEPGQKGFGDTRQLEQVIINLAKNAMESGSAPEEIRVRVRGDATGTQWRVVDRGPGMNGEALASALLPFYSTKRSGSGLGLSLCREIVDAHGGRIGLRNRTGGGLSVSVWIPGAGQNVVATGRQSA